MIPLRLAAPLAGVYGVGCLGAVLHGLISWNVLESLPPAVARGAELGYGVWAAMTLLLLHVGLGAAVLRAPFFRRREWTGIEAAVFRLAVGSYVSYAIFLGLALAGALTPAGLGGYAALAAACLAAAMRREAGKVAEAGCVAEGPELGALSEDRPRLRLRVKRDDGAEIDSAPAGRLPWWTWPAVAVWAAPYLAQTLLPSLDADGFMYHLPLAERYLAGRILEVDPYFPAHNFPGAISLFYAGFLAIGAEAAVLPYNFLSGLAILAAVYALGSRFWGRGAGVWAVLLALPINVAWEVALTPRVDTQLAFYVVMAAFAFLLWIETRRVGYVAILGALLGMALSIKYTALAFVAVFAAAGFLALFRAARPVRSVAVFCLALAMSPAWFWYGRNGILLNDPVYPLLHGRMYFDDEGRLQDFRALAREFAQHNPSAEEIQSKLASTQARFLNEPRANRPSAPRHTLRLWRVILTPWQYEMNPYHSVGPFVLLALVAPFACRDRAARWLAALGLACYVAMGSQHWVIRYVLPPLMLFPVMGAAAMTAFLRAEANRPSEGLRWAMGALAVVLALCLAWDWTFTLFRDRATRGVGYLLPFLIAFGALAAAALLAWTKPFRQGSAFGSLAAGLIAVIAAGYVTRDWTCETFKLGVLQPQAFLLGQESRREYVARRDLSGLPQLGQWLRRQIRQGRIDPHAQVLLLGDYKGYLLPLDYLPDDNLNGYRLKVEVMKVDGDAAKLKERLLAQRIRYIAVNLAQIEWFHFQEPRLYRRELAAFALYYGERLLQGHARAIYRDQGVLVLDLGAPPPGQGAG